MEKIDFLAIGDIVIDAFIELQDAKVHCDINNDNCTISMRFGDKIPYKNVKVVKAVGNSPNASVSAARLGLNSAVVTHVGNDENGKECIETLKRNKVNTDFVEVQDEFTTNYHYVLSYDADRTILIKHANFRYNWNDVVEKLDNPPSWLYFSSVAENSLPYHDDIARYLEKNPEVKLAFQPGTFQIKLGKDRLREIYKNTHVFFCNKEEAQRVLEIKDNNIKNLLAGIRDLGPKIAVITDGPDGAYAMDSEATWYMPIYPDPEPPKERTGAGDSFSSTFTAALASGLSTEEALMWAPINSMSVVQYIGAQEGLLHKDELLRWLEKRPEDYKPKKL